MQDAGGKEEIINRQHPTFDSQLQLIIGCWLLIIDN
jgi:hypothetical protein